MKRTLPQEIKITDDLVDEAIELFRAAYRSDPSVPVMFAGLSDERREVALAAVCRTLLRVVRRYGIANCTIKDGRMIGIGLFYPPGGYPPWHAQAAALLGLIPKTGLRVAGRLFSINFKSARRMPPGNNYYYAVICCVHPNSQGRAVSLYYTRWIYDLADRTGHPIYSETTNEHNVPLWVRVGYRLTGEATFNGVKHWFFWRDPRPKT